MKIVDIKPHQKKRPGALAQVVLCSWMVIYVALSSFTIACEIILMTPVKVVTTILTAITAYVLRACQ